MRKPTTLQSLLLVIAANATSLTADGPDGFKATMPGTTESLGIGEFDLCISRTTHAWTTRVSVTVDGHTYWHEDVKWTDFDRVSKAWRCLITRVFDEREEAGNNVIRQFTDSLTDLPEQDVS